MPSSGRCQPGRHVLLSPPADRAKYTAGKAAGLKYGGADAEAKRRAARAKIKRRQKARIDFEHGPAHV